MLSGHRWEAYLAEQIDHVVVIQARGWQQNAGALAVLSFPWGEGTFSVLPETRWA